MPLLLGIGGGVLALAVAGFALAVVLLRPGHAGSAMRYLPDNTKLLLHFDVRGFLRIERTITSAFQYCVGTSV